MFLTSFIYAQVDIVPTLKHIETGEIEEAQSDFKRLNSRYPDDANVKVPFVGILRIVIISSIYVVKYAILILLRHHNIIIINFSYLSIYKLIGNTKFDFY